VSFNGTSVGLDVDALLVVAHAVDEQSGLVERARLCPDHGEILNWLRQLRGPVRVAYEAGPTGFGLARALADAQIECTVAAPSKLIGPAGDRVKPTPATPRTYLGCYAWARSPQSPCPNPTWRQCVIWSVPARMPVPT
jgi:hypothetical protein